MQNSKLNLYMIFIATFLVMHFTGVVVSDLPYLLNGLITSGTVLVVLLVLLLSTSEYSFKDTVRSIGIHGTNLKGIFPGIIISTVLLLTYPLIGHLFNAEVSLVQNWPLNLVGLLLTGGLTEEVLFRGYFFGSLRRKMSFRKAVVISAVFFTLAHLLLFAYMDWPVALLSTLLAIASSVPLAFLFEFGNGTVWSPALVHTSIRTVGLVVTTNEHHFGQFSLLWIIASIVVPYIVLLFYKDFRNSWTT